MGPETYGCSSGARLGRLPQGGTNELADTPSAMESGGRLGVQWYRRETTNSFAVVLAFVCNITRLFLIPYRFRYCQYHI